MDLKSLGHNWDLLGETDPMWAILMHPDRRGNRWDPAEFFTTGHHDVSHALKMLRELRIPLERRSALDFGCGLGRLTQALACYFDEVSGVDISPAMIRGARGYNPYGDRCRFYVNERNDLSIFESNRFDFVFSLIVLQHMRPEYALDYVAEFMRIVARGGVVLFQEPSHYKSTPAHQDYRPLDYRIRRKLGHYLFRARRRAGHFGLLEPIDEAGCASLARPQHAMLPPVLAMSGSHLRVDKAHSSMNQEEPRTEVHVVPKVQMLDHLKRCGGRVLHVEPRNECSPYHRSYRYFVTK